jgi:hypothetical protein
MIGLILAGISFVWGLAAWVNMRFYRPIPPGELPVSRFSFRKDYAMPPYSRYQSLAGGRMFFEVAAPLSDLETQRVQSGIFHSNLIVWGIIKGTPSTAVVGLDQKSNSHTRIVKSGGIVEGEQLVAIGENYILVKNDTGKGRVYLPK